MIPELDIIIRLLTEVILGGIVGFERLTLTIFSRLEKRLKSCSLTTCQYYFLITTIISPGQIGKIGEYFGKDGIGIREFPAISEDEGKNT